MTGTLMICNLLIAAILIRLEDAIANERTDEDAKEARKLRKSFRTSARETFVRRCGAVCWSGVRDPYVKRLAPLLVHYLTAIPPLLVHYYYTLPTHYRDK